MTIAGLFAAIGGVATIVGAGYGIFRYFAWRFTKTPAEQDQDIDKQVEDEEKKIESGGRPTWGP